MHRNSTHPGELLAEQLEELAMNCHQFSTYSGIEFAHLQGILDCVEPVTEEDQAKLNEVFDNNSSLWVRMQQAYDNR